MECERILLKGLPNTRDLGGYPTADGRRLKRRRLLRSGTLFHGTKEDIRLLREEYGLRKIIDLRTGVEREQMPDPEIEGVIYVHNPLFQEETMGISREKKQREADIVDVMIRICREIGGDNNRYMEELYPKMVTDEYTLAQMKRFYEELASQKEGSILFHCTEGKDRVGTTAALFLLLMGVPEETVLADYQRTNVFLKDRRESILALVAKRGGDENLLAQVDSMNSVDVRYLQAVLQKVKALHGNVESFFHNGLGFSHGWVQELKENYLD